MAVTNRALTGFFAALAAALAVPLAGAAVLPEDRADIMYHSYDGGGVTISGPSILVRKEFADTVSVHANYYVDEVSGASIDVQAAATSYTEEREQVSVGADYLYDKTIMSLVFTNSSENDYEASTVAFGISQDFFGDLTTLSLGYSVGDDTVMKNNDETFEEDAQRRRYSINLSQILTKNWIIAFNAESVVDEGYLNNPYRSVRYRDSSFYSFQPERYPGTRNSDALALRTLYYLPYRASIKVEGRYFSDSWGVEANNYELRYIHPLGQRWIFEGKVRYYDQTQADFYSDLYEYEDAQNFLARDKELSTYTNTNVGLGITYEIRSPYLSAFDSTTVNLFWDHMMFEYENFRNVLLSQSGEYAPGEEPLYSFDANVIRLFFTLTY